VICKGRSTVVKGKREGGTKAQSDAGRRGKDGCLGKWGGMGDLCNTLESAKSKCRRPPQEIPGWKEPSNVLSEISKSLLLAIKGVVVVW